jgi:hypothetical protein
MPDDERRAHWDHVYATRNPDELAWHQARPALSLELIERAGMGNEARIVDLGGGASRLVDALVDDGFQRVTVLDISPEALGRVKERLGDRARLVTRPTSHAGSRPPPSTSGTTGPSFTSLSRQRIEGHTGRPSRLRSP